MEAEVKLPVAFLPPQLLVKLKPFVANLLATLVSPPMHCLLLVLIFIATLLLRALSSAHQFIRTLCV